MSNAKIFGQVFACVFVAVLVYAVDNENFRLYPTLRAIPGLFLVSLPFAFFILWPIWMANVWVTAKSKRQSLYNFVNSPGYIDLLNEDRNQKRS
jgi:hypothetical protein